MEYPQEIERDMKTFYASRSAKDRRRYAAIEAAKPGHGGIEYVARLPGCDVKTIRQGRRDMKQPPELPPGKVRKKESIATVPGIRFTKRYVATGYAKHLGLVRATQ